MLGDRNTTSVPVSRAPLPKPEAYKTLKEWRIPWYSSFGSDFNDAFHITLDETVAPIEYNYKTQAEIEENTGTHSMQGKGHGLSIFFRIGDRVFHTYSVYARGVEGLRDAHSLLDTTPYGRRENFEDSPAGCLSDQPIDNQQGF